MGGGAELNRTKLNHKAKKVSGGGAARLVRLLVI